MTQNTFFPLTVSYSRRRHFIQLIIASSLSWGGFAWAQSDPDQLLQTGLTLYQDQDYPQAIEVWEQALQLYQRQNQDLHQAMTLNYLSSAHQQLSNWTQAEIALSHSLRILETQADTPQPNQIKAQALNAQGSLRFSLGQPDLALRSWQEASDLYAKLGDQLGYLGAQINQSQALQSQGFYGQAKSILDQVALQAEESHDTQIQITSFHALGNAQLSLGQLVDAEASLQKSLESVTPETQDIVPTLYRDLGHVARAQADNARQIDNSEDADRFTELAIQYYERSSQTTDSPRLKVQALLGEIDLLSNDLVDLIQGLSLLTDIREVVNANNPAYNTVIIDRLRQRLIPQIQTRRPQIRTLYQTIWPLINSLPPSRDTSFIVINLIKTWQQLKQINVIDFLDYQEMNEKLRSIILQAQTKDDKPTQSDILGTQGALLLDQGRFDEALVITQQALFISQSIEADHLSYLWQDQMGRIYQAQGNNLAARSTFADAYITLQSLRRDIVSINKSIQFSFRDKVEPIYRNYVSTLLQPEQVTPAAREQAQEVIESLQIAELNNFFRDSCIDLVAETSQPKQIDQIDPQAAVVYPVILPNRLEIILSLPNHPLQSHSVLIDQSKLQAWLVHYRRTLVDRVAPADFRAPSQQLYDWVIRPMQRSLEQANIKTLVFVLDSLFRNISMATLYDREKQEYLVEQYDIAITPGLSLFDPQPLQRNRLQILRAGISKPRSGFIALPNVPIELNQIGSLVRGQDLVDEAFTQTALQKAVNQIPFAVVHLATHGQFSSQAEQTFILAWDERITVSQLQNLLRSQNEAHPEAIELLALSACETASGDDRAALGLAGIAVRAGARSTLASLWSVSDESTAQLMVRFYEELVKSGATKSGSLAIAQRQLLQERRYQHPYFWSPFVLVGNWL